MDEILIKYAYALKQSIEQSTEVVKLNELEAQLENDDSFLMLRETYKEKELALNKMYETTYFLPEQEKATKQQLFVAKQNIDKHPLVVKYYVQYQKVKKLYQIINAQIFDPLCKTEGASCFLK